MSTRIVSPPFIVFEDIDGEPLQSGYIYLGLPGLNPQVSPISVYSDAALTVPLAQPLRTVAGYVSSNGTPSKVYVDGDFSITVLNKNSTLVYTSLTGNGLSTGDTFTREETIAISEGAAFASVVPLEIRNVVDAQYFFDETNKIVYASLTPLSGSISNVGVAAAGVLAIVLDGVSVNLYSPSLAKGYSHAYRYAVDQLAGGDESLVGFIFVGQVVDEYDYLVDPVGGLTYSRGSVEGTITSAFIPSSGTAGGLDGPLLVVNSILNKATLLSCVDVSAPEGVLVETSGYAAQGDGGGGSYLVVSESDYAGIPDGFTDHALPNGNILKLIPNNGEYNAKQCGIKGDGSDEATAIYAFESTLKATVMNAFFPAGTYDVGVMNWPFRQSGFTPLKDYGGIVVRGAGKGKTIFSTTSSVGADVLQLNAIKGITFKDLSTTATLTAFDDAGSNGVSITNGGEDIHIDIDHFDLPGVDKGVYLDGGKAFTIQNGGATVHGYSNITMKGNAKDCPYLFESSVTFDTFSTVAGKNIKSVKVDISGEDCWRGVVLSSAEPTGIVDASDLGSGIEIDAHLINCAQPNVISRWCGGSVKTTTINTKMKADLYKPFPADQSVIGQLLVNGIYCESRSHGLMKQVDTKLLIGGSSMGSFGLITYSYKCQVENTLSTPFVIADEIVVQSFGGNTTQYCDVKIARVLDATGQALINQTNSVSYNQAISTRRINIKRDGQTYSTFSADAGSGEVSMARQSTSAVGAYVGYVNLTDSVSGVIYKVQLFS
jgi:hypothetical protein